MALGDGSMFPIVDRNTPVMNRALKRGSGKHIGRALGKVVGMGLTADPDDEEMEEKANNLLEGFGRGLADELEIADEAIDENSVRELGRFLFGTRVEGFLTEEAKEELGIGIVDVEGEQNDTEEDTEASEDSDDEESEPQERIEEPGDDEDDEDSAGVTFS